MSHTIAALISNGICTLVTGTGINKSPFCPTLTDSRLLDQLCDLLIARLEERLEEHLAGRLPANPGSGLRRGSLVCALPLLPLSIVSASPGRFFKSSA